MINAKHKLLCGKAGLKMHWFFCKNCREMFYLQMLTVNSCPKCHMALEVWV